MQIELALVNHTTLRIYSSVGTNQEKLGKCKMKNETELKPEKEKMRNLIHPQWGKGNYIQYGGLLNYQAIVANYLRQTN
jgi:hypothetical protein